MKKNQIKTAFSRAAETYDLAAEVQTLSSTHLCEMIEVPFSPQKILDIGCGTGITSVEMMKKYPQAHYTLCDISEKMIDEAKRKIKKDAQFIVCDAEKYDFPEKYDLGISNLALQWFESPHDFIEKILGHCRFFAFSTLIEGSFCDWRKNLEDCGTFSGAYPSSEDIIRACRRCGVLKRHEIKKYDLQFESMFESAKYFKKLGATANFTNKNGTLSALRRHNQNITLNYEVFFALLMAPS
ncbi:MAG: methyltransferase domain-containing protein [Holosporaceae bacterium]|jgi:malonyl-ACP O-methyltransferase BioC|nr:methyltransferase domain-containing protein [Holosporaceae bacterium]